jgi:hypothetical protein
MQYSAVRSDVLPLVTGTKQRCCLVRRMKVDLHSAGQLITILYGTGKSIPVAARSKAWVRGRSLAGIVGLNPAEGIDVCLLLVLCVVR